MRFRFVFRLLTSVLALNATLASPVMALAHGEAHEHELGEHAHAAPANSATHTAEQAGATDLLDEGHADHDAALHRDCLARAGAQQVASTVTAPAVLIDCTVQMRAPTAAPAPSLASPLGRAAPPDQPRAPPLG